MDRPKERKLKGILSKFSNRDLIGAELNESKLIYNVIGFVPLTDSVDNSTLISNLAYLVAEQGMNTCVVDFKVFFPNLYLRYGLSPLKKGQGLLKVLKSDKTDLREHIKKTDHEGLYLLSPSPQDLMEEYFDFDLEDIEKLINELKSIFDIVLIDIPNNPPLEFCVGAIKNIHVGFVTCNERIETLTNVIKFFDYLQSIGVSTAKLSNIIFADTLNLEYDYKALEEHGMKIVGVIPQVKNVYKYALDNQLYIKEAQGFNKYYHRELTRLAQQLTKE